MYPDKAGKQLGQRTSLQFSVLSSGGSVKRSSPPNLEKEQKSPHRKHDDKIEQHLLWLINLTEGKFFFSLIFLCMAKAHFLKLKGKFV